MALLNIKATTIVGTANAKIVSGRFDFDSSYPAGGYPSSQIAKAIGLDRIANMIFSGMPISSSTPTTAATFIPIFDIVNNTIRCYGTVDELLRLNSPELTAGNNLSDFKSVSFIAFGS